MEERDILEQGRIYFRGEGYIRAREDISWRTGIYQSKGGYILEERDMDILEQERGCMNKVQDI